MIDLFAVSVLPQGVHGVGRETLKSVWGNAKGGEQLFVCECRAQGRQHGGKRLGNACGDALFEQRAVLRERFHMLPELKIVAEAGHVHPALRHPGQQAHGGVFSENGEALLGHLVRRDVGAQRGFKPCGFDRKFGEVSNCVGQNAFLQCDPHACGFTVNHREGRVEGCVGNPPFLDGTCGGLIQKRLNVLGFDRGGWP